MPSNILVTGADGFVGMPLCRFLRDEGYSVRGAIRHHTEFDNAVAEIDYVPSGHIGSSTDWLPILDRIDCVVHLAARVHTMNDSANDPLAEFRKVNVSGSERLAKQAEEAGVRRFIYLSSIKVNGEETGRRSDGSGLHEKKVNNCFSENDIPNPQNPYAVSKAEAEQALLKITAETGMDLVIIRPPLVYGPGVKANFMKMMHWLCMGVPLPLGAIDNKRSLLALDNLVDLIFTCIENPAAANQTFLAGDGENISTTELLHRMGNALGKPARLVPVPHRLLEFGLKMLGKDDMAKRLCGSLQIDISKARGVLGWNPPVSVDEGLTRTAEWYKGRAER